MKLPETAGLFRDQFVKRPRSSRWYDMHADKKDSDLSTVCSWSPEPAKLNQAAGLSRCLTRVQDAMSTQLNSLHMDKSKGKSSERMQQAVDELEYLVTFNQSISQAMARTMQDLSEGVFISVVNFTLASRDSYLDYMLV